MTFCEAIKSLDPQVFENLVQSLCRARWDASLGSFMSVHENVREASFEGQISGSNETGALEGRNGLIACLCPDIPMDQASSMLWASEQLKGRLTADRTANGAPSSESHYILVTNIQIAVEDRPKIGLIVEAIAKREGFKSHEVWDTTTVAKFLNDAPNIQAEYVGWLKPNLILSDIAKTIGGHRFERLISLGLARDVCLERDARIRDAGQESERSVYLENVFVDLPIGRHVDLHQFDAANVPEHNARDRGATADGAVRRLWTLLRHKQAPESPEGQIQGARDTLGKSPLNRVVLLGGPGQGKSTLGQFLSQMLRARLLSTLPPISLKAEVVSVVRSIRERADEEGFRFEHLARYPLRIDLPIFADALKRASDQGAELSLMSFAAERLCRGLGSSFSDEELRKWLSAVPSVTVLDGLDEVPPSSNRKSVLDAINSYVDDLHFLHADFVVVVTSRPQGYANDFDRQFWQHWQLRALKSDEAIAFAERLSSSRMSDKERAGSVLDELRRACEDETTSALMSSPLQVMILFNIALLKGAIPQNRWDLFERYYSLLRDREATKPSDDAKLLRDYRSTIDRIHQECGFLLQCRSEHAGATNAYLTPEVFREVIVRLLRQDEYADDQVHHISERLSKIATDRLVLLAARVQDRIAFDVRSLQEFMAAARLTTFSKASLLARLKTIASSAHWRHVLRISISRIFSDASLESFRSDVVSICHSLNEGDDDDDARRVLAGAQLAMEILEDGGQPPRFRKQLIRCAMRRLSIDDDETADMVAAQWDANTRDVVRNEVSAAFEAGLEIAASKAAFSLLPVDKAWAEELLLSIVPRRMQSILRAASCTPPTNWTPRIVDRIRDAQWACQPADAQELIWECEARWPEQGQHFAGICALPEAFQLGSIVRAAAVPTFADELWGGARESSVKLMGSRFSLTFVPLEGASRYAVSDCPANAHQSWRLFQAVAPFLRNACKATLLEALSKLSHDDIDGASQFWRRFPWVLSGIFWDHLDGQSLDSIKCHVASPAFGDVEDWRRMERVWTENGVSLSGIEQWNRGFYLNDVRDLNQWPCPVSLRARGPLNDNAQKLLVAIVQAGSGLVNEGKRSRLIRWVDVSTRQRGTVDRSTAWDIIGDALLTFFERKVELGSLSMLLAQRSTAAWSNEKFVKAIESEIGGKTESLPIVRDTKGLVNAYIADPTRRGLLALIGRATSTNRAQQWLGEMPLAELQIRDSDSPAVKFGVWQIRWAMGAVGLEQVPDMVEVLFERANSIGLSHWDAKMFNIENDPMKEDLVGRIFRNLADLLSTWEDEEHSVERRYSKSLILERLASHLQSKPSGLQQSVTRQELDLPSL